MRKIALLLLYTPLLLHGVDLREKDLISLKKICPSKQPTIAQIHFIFNELKQNFFRTHGKHSSPSKKYLIGKLRPSLQSLCQNEIEHVLTENQQVCSKDLKNQDKEHVNSLLNPVINFKHKEMAELCIIQGADLEFNHQSLETVLKNHLVMLLLSVVSNSPPKSSISCKELINPPGSCGATSQGLFKHFYGPDSADHILNYWSTILDQKEDFETFKDRRALDSKGNALRFYKGRAVNGLHVLNDLLLHGRAKKHLVFKVAFGGHSFLIERVPLVESQESTLYLHQSDFGIFSLSEHYDGSRIKFLTKNFMKTLLEMTQLAKSIESSKPEEGVSATLRPEYLKRHYEIFHKGPLKGRKSPLTSLSTLPLGSNIRFIGGEFEKPKVISLLSDKILSIESQFQAINQKLESSDDKFIKFLIDHVELTVESYTNKSCRFIEADLKQCLSHPKDDLLVRIKCEGPNSL